MTSREQLLKLEEKEKQFEVQFEIVNKVEDSIAKLNKIYEWIGYIISYLLTLTIATILNHRFDYSAIFYCLFVAIYVYIFLYAAFEKFYGGLAQRKTYKRFATTEAEITELKQLNRELKREKYTLTKKIYAEQEDDFINRLTDFINKISYRRLSLFEATKTKEQLEKENAVIKSNGYQIHREVFYKNRFEKIDDILKNYTTTFSDNKKEEIRKNISTQNSTAKTLNNSDGFKEKHIQSDAEQIKTPAVKKEEFNDSEEIISNLFQVPIQKESKEKVSAQYKVSIKQDFLKLHQHNLSIGELGELFVIKKEEERLTRKGLSAHISEIIHCSKDNDSLGYDIISFTDEKTKKYIEVKTTTNNHTTPFFLSLSEIEAMKVLENYFIYRVFNFDVERCEGRFYVLDCKKDFQNYFNVEPISFKVSPK